MSQSITEISNERRNSQINHSGSSKSEDRHSRHQLILNKKLITLMIQNKNIDILYQFIETSGVDINYFNNEYNPLCYLLKIYQNSNSNISILKCLKILNNFNVNYNIVLEDGKIPLFEFLKIELYECLQVLKSAKEIGANMYQLDKKKRNLLMYAIKKGVDVKIIKYLFSLNYNLRNQDINGDTVYNYATIYHNSISYNEVLPFLLDNFIYDNNVIITLILMGKNKQQVSRQTIIDTIRNNNELINIKNNEGDNPLFIAIKNHYHVNILSYFIYLGSRVNEVDNNGLNPLMIAVENGNFKAFSYLTQFYSNFNYKNNNGDTILTIAAKKNDLKMVFLLLNLCLIKEYDEITEKKRESFIHTFQSKILEELKFANDGTNDTNFDDFDFFNINSINNKNLNINEQDKEGETALSIAIKNKNKPMIYNLLVCGADPSITNNKKENAVIKAAQTNDEDIMELILNIHDDVNSIDENHDTAIIIAVRNSNLNIVNKLLEKNADITIRDKESNTPLMIAACNDNNLEIVDSLLKQKNNTLYDINKDGKTAFLLSVEKNCQNIAKSLLKLGVSVSDIDRDVKKNNALLLASKYGNYEVVCDLVDNDYIDINSQNENLNTALIKASKNNWVNVVKYLSRKKADLEIKNKKGNTALIVACMQKNIDVVKCLLDSGADIENFNNKGVTPVIVACQHNDLSTLQTLILDYNAEVNYEHELPRSKMEECFIEIIEQGYYKIVKFLLNQDYRFNIAERNNNFYRLLSAIIYDTNNAYYRVLEVILPHPYFNELLEEFRQTRVLIPACQQMKKKTINLLLQYDINVNVKDEHNNTALIEASLHPFLFNFVKEFIDRNADLNVINDEGMSALLNSCRDSDNRIFKYLVDKGANIYITDHFGNNALMHACCYDDLEKIKYLYRKGVNINTKNDDGETALMRSVKAGKYNIVKYLIKHNAEVNILNNKNQNALVIAFLTVYEKEVVENKDLLIIKMLISKKSDPNVPIDEKGNSILMYLIMKNDFSMIKYMMKAYSDKLDINQKNHLGHNAFMYALKCNNHKIIEFLISSKKINILDEDDYGNDIIMYSTCSMNPDYAKKFISSLHGNMINKCNHSRETYLIMASKINNEKVIDTLLDKGADVDHQESKGNTILHYAASQGNIDTINKLILHKANLEIQNYQRETPLMVACRFKQRNAIEMLLSHGANTLFIDNEIYSDRKSMDFKQDLNLYVDLMIEYYSGISESVPENYLSIVTILQRMKRFYEPVTIKDGKKRMDEILKDCFEDFFEYLIESFTNQA